MIDVNVDSPMMKEASELLHEVMNHMEQKAGDNFCSYCVGRYEVEGDIIPIGHEINCIYPKIESWLFTYHNHIKES